MQTDNLSFYPELFSKMAMLIQGQAKCRLARGQYSACSERDTSMQGNTASLLRIPDITSGMPTPINKMRFKTVRPSEIHTSLYGKQFAFPSQWSNEQSL